jgi:hypothetical protein
LNNPCDPFTPSGFTVCGLGTARSEAGSLSKWADFTYIGRKTKLVTKIFKKTDLKISYTTNKTLGNLLRPKASAFLIYFVVEA